jgi:hypothetical protein
MRRAADFGWLGRFGEANAPPHLGFRFDDRLFRHRLAL